MDKISLLCKDGTQKFVKHSIFFKKGKTYVYVRVPTCGSEASGPLDLGL